jgi:tryptophan halogenase
MNNIKNIIVVGGGTAGWISAAYLSSKCKFNVTLIESDTIKIIGVGESTIPSIVDIFKSCNITDQDLHDHCNAVRKYGIKHHNWTKNYGVWEHWFAFNNDSVDDSIAAMNQYIEGPAGRYSYHLDANRLPGLIKEKNPNVNRVIDDIIEVVVDDTGVKKLVGNKATYSADFYIDCSGYKSILRGKFPSTVVRHKNLINTYAVAGPLNHTTDTTPCRFTQTFAMNYGWRWKIDLQHRSGNGYAFNKDFVSVDQAVDEFVKASGVRPADVFEVPILNSFNSSPWHKNVLSVGLSSGFLEPLEATGIFLNYLIIELFEKFHNHPRGQDILNRMWSNTYKGIADFLELFYTTSDLDHTEYWRSFNKVDSIVYQPNNLFKKYPSWTGLAQNRRVKLID